MSKSQYAKRMGALGAQIFGEVATKTDGKSMKVVKMFSKRPMGTRFDVTEYYPRHIDIARSFKILRYFGLHRDEHLDFNDVMKQKHVAKGSAKPKKGEGKRALKRKKQAG